MVAASSVANEPRVLIDLRITRIPLRTALRRQLEAGIMAQIGRVIAILMARRDHHNPETDNVGQIVPDLGGIARIAQAIGEPPRQSRLALDLAQTGQPGVGAHVGTVKSEQDRLAIEG